MKKLLVSRPLPEPVLEEVREHFETVVRQTNRPMSTPDMVTALAEYDAILPTLGDLFSSAIFEQAPSARCKILANFGVGYNHIDTFAAAKSGIMVTNTPGAVTDATADIAMTLMLMSARRAAEGERLVRSGNWAGWHPTQMLGMHLSGKTVGIVGLGRIGQAIAQRCYFGFGMRVCFFNRSSKRMEFDARQLESIEELAREVDVLVAAVPGGAETKHLIGESVLSQMQPHAHLINISRGDVIDESALIEALQQSRIAGAGLDVYENEPDVPEALIALDNVTLLPHLGTAALEVRTSMGMMAAANLKAFALGKQPANLVN